MNTSDSRGNTITDFILLDVQLLWASASEHLDEALKTGNLGAGPRSEAAAPLVAEDRVVGLMAALEASVNAAKKTRSELRS